MPPAFEVLLLNTAIPQIQAAQSGDTYVVPRDIAFSAALTLSAGTANGVPYLNASKVLTTGSALTFDGTNFALTGKFSVSQNSAGLAAEFTNADATNGYGVSIAAGGTSATRYALVVRNPASTQDYFKISTVTGEVGHSIFAPGAPGSSEIARFTSTGLGIGTSSPLARLHSNNSSSGATALTAIFGNGAAAALNNGSAIFLNNSSSFNGSTYSARIASVITNGSTQASDLIFGLYNGSQNNDLMRLDSSGNLGLGVTPSTISAGRNLEVGFAGSGIYSYSQTDTEFLSNAYYNVGYKFGGTGRAMMYAMGTAGSGIHSWHTSTVSGTAGAAISFTQAMTLDASGNLGIGETNPNFRLEVRGSTVTNGDAIRNMAVISTNSASAGLGGGIAFGGYYNGTTNDINDFAGIQGFKENGTAGDYAGALRFTTRVNGGTPTERARITSGGDLLVGNNPTNIRSSKFVVGNAIGGGTGAEINNTDSSSWISLAFHTAGTLVGYISNTTTTTAYNTSSDYRLKDNQQPLTGSGAFIDALKPKTWDWKSGGKGVGFIAHEVQEVSPGTVVGEKDAVDANGKPIMQAMEYGSAEFIANIIAELQSLRARVAQLEQGA